MRGRKEKNSVCVCGMEQGKKGKEKGKEEMGKGRGAEMFREEGETGMAKKCRVSEQMTEASGKGAYEKGFDPKKKRN